MNLKTFARSCMFSILSVLIAGGIAVTAFGFSPATAVFADTGPTPAPRARRTDEQKDQRLVFNYQNEQQWLSKQQGHLDKANQGVTKVQQLIEKAKGKNVDVSALETALAAFKTKIASAQSAHAQAASILAAHTGFDASGNVTDRTAAHQTLLDGRLALRDAQSILRQATAEFRQAVRTWRQQRLNKATPASNS